MEKSKFDKIIGELALFEWIDSPFLGIVSPEDLENQFKQENQFKKTDSDKGVNSN